MVTLDEKMKNIPICDTNILINFGLERILNRFIEFNKGIFIADNVLKELENKLGNSSSYKFLVNDVKQNDNINIINKDKYFTEEKIMVMAANLNQYEITEDTLLKGETCKDSGEFISAIYAANLGIPTILLSIPLRYMHSPAEIVNLDDVENTIKLLAQIIVKLNKNMDFNPLED